MLAFFPKKHLSKFNNKYLFDKLQTWHGLCCIAAFPDGAFFSSDTLLSVVIYNVVKSGG